MQECDRGAISNDSGRYQYFKGPTFLEDCQRGQTRAQRSLVFAGMREVAQSKGKRYQGLENVKTCTKLYIWKRLAKVTIVDILIGPGFSLERAFPSCPLVGIMQVRRPKQDTKLIRPRRKRHMDRTCHAVLVAECSRASRILLSKLARMLACSAHIAFLVSYLPTILRRGKQQARLCRRLHLLFDIIH